MRKAGNHYNKLAKDYPGAKPFDELSPERQTIIASRVFQRGGNWYTHLQASTNPGKPTELFKAIMGSYPNEEDRKAAAVKALGRDAEMQTTNGMNTRYSREQNYLKKSNEPQ